MSILSGFPAGAGQSCFNVLDSPVSAEGANFTGKCLVGFHHHLTVPPFFLAADLFFSFFFLLLLSGVFLSYRRLGWGALLICFLFCFGVGFRSLRPFSTSIGDREQPDLVVGV